MCAAVTGMGRARAVKKAYARGTRTHRHARERKRRRTVGGGCDRTKDKRATISPPPPPTRTPQAPRHGRQHGRRPSSVRTTISGSSLRHTHTATASAAPHRHCTRCGGGGDALLVSSPDQALSVVANVRSAVAPCTTTVCIPTTTTIITFVPTITTSCVPR